MRGIIFFLGCFVTGFIFAKPELSETQEKIRNMEQAVAETQREIRDLLLEQQETVRDLHRTKQILKQSQKLRREFIPSSWKPSLTELDYNRYPPSPYSSMFRYTSIDKANELEFHGWLQVDEDIFLNAQGLLLNNGVSNVTIINKNTVDRFWLRRLRPTIEGTIYNYFNFVFNPDFGEGQLRVYDAFVDINYLRILGFQAGLQMSLLSGIENYFENYDYLARSYTMEMSNTAMLAPDREFGFVLHGSLGPSGQEPYFRGLSYLGFDDFFSYQLGVLSGTADNSNPGVNPTALDKTSTEESTILNKVFEGRIFMNPFIDRPSSILHHLGLGFAASTERAHLQGNLPDLFSLGQNVIYFYNPVTLNSICDPSESQSIVANGLRTRVHPQAVWGFGPLGLLADWNQTLQTLQYIDQTLTNESFRSIVQKNHASQVQLIYNLTKEEFNLFNLTPNRNFHFFESGAIGAWQLVLRYTGLSLDPNVFSQYEDYFDGTSEQRHYYYVDPRTSVQSSNSWSIGLNWFWNTHIRFTFEYAQSSFKGGCSTGALNAPVNPGCLSGLLYAYGVNSQVVDRPDEKIIMQRFQLTF